MKLERHAWSSRENSRSGVHKNPQSHGISIHHQGRVYGRVGMDLRGTFEDWLRIRSLRKSRKRSRRENKAASEAHPNFTAPLCK